MTHGRTSARYGARLWSDGNEADERACIQLHCCVDRCPTERPTMDHLRVTPAEERESVDLAIVADG